MNKKDLIELVADYTGMSKADAGRAVDAVFKRITDALKTGNEAVFVGFGTFKVAQRRARTGRNPQSGAVIEIKAQKTVKFSVGKALKDAVNGKA